MFSVFALANASNLNGGAWPRGCQEFHTCALAQTLHCLEMLLACLAPQGLSSHVGTIHYSYSSPLLLLQSFILYCLLWKQTPKQSCLSKTQPGNSPTFSPFSKYTVVARHYLCIVSLKPSKPKLWFSCWKSSVPWLRDNYGHSSTRGKKKKAVPQYTGLREHTGGQREQSEIHKTWFRAGGSEWEEGKALKTWNAQSTGNHGERQWPPWNMPKRAAKKKNSFLSPQRIK